MSAGAVFNPGLDLRAPRFFGDVILASCLTGHRILAGGGDPPETVARIQKALADLGFTVIPDGTFGSQTGAAVTAYKAGKEIEPNDPVVGAETMSALDGDFAHELFDEKAAAIAGTPFALGARIGARVDLEDGLAICAYEKGISVEVGRLIAYALPAQVASAWLESGGANGSMGLPTSDPYTLDGARSAQEFALATRIFGTGGDFTWPRVMWQAWASAQGMLGVPTGPPAPQVTVTFDDPPEPLPQVVVKVVDSIPLSLGQGGSLGLDQLAALAPGSDAVVAALRALLPDITFGRLFDLTTPEEINTAVSEAVANDPSYKPPRFENFLLLDCPPGFATDPLVAIFNTWVAVEVAYNVDHPEPATVVGTTNPKFAQQGYLFAAPQGIGVQSAWAKGADGTGIGLIDIEHAWFLTHEDLPPGIPLLQGVNRAFGRGHGCGVLGVIAAVDNTTGVVGIASKTVLRLLSIEDSNPALNNQFRHLAALISRAWVASARGDVVTLELHAKEGPVELDLAVFEAIRLCVARDIIVVEAAGNHTVNLDVVKDAKGKRFLDRTIAGEFRDSGAILVGAGTAAVPHRRLSISNFGNRVDCYGWGEKVTTTGKVDAKKTDPPVRPNDYFEFSGTSSAAAIIAGVCVLMQHLNAILKPATLPIPATKMRTILSSPTNGTIPGLPSDNIGVMPDFAQLLVNAF